jgi:hypothetical protein
MQGAEEFSASLGVPMRAERLKVPISRSCRPSVAETVAFIEQSLANDSPVAFLILSSGATPALDSWHWVTIFDLDKETTVIHFIDNGEKFQADIGRWLETSIMGGSFVRLVPAEDSSSLGTA